MSPHRPPLKALSAQYAIPLPAPYATGSAPLPSAGFKWLFYVKSLILKARMALFVQIWAQRQMHSRCTILHNPAQSCTTGPTVGVKARRTDRKILEARFPSSTARFGVRRLILTP
jgi:hypothetical protein